MKINLFSVPISIITKSQALALIGEWLREWHDRKSQLKSAKSAKIGLQKKSEKSDSDSADLSSIRSGPPPAGQADPADTPTFPKIIVTPNPEIIVAAQSDPTLMKALQSADLAIPDGIGVVWALRLLSSTSSKSSTSSTSRKTIDVKTCVTRATCDTCATFPRRLSGLELMESLIFQPQKVAPYELHPLKVMLLGGRPGVAQAAAAKLRRRFEKVPNLPSLEGSEPSIRALSGPQNISAISKSENDRLIAQINSFQPDLLFVAFGHPRQEKWLTENRERLTAGVAMAVGGAFDQLADPSLRPPPYINSIGLGWLYRLLRQPWRIKRQLALVKFAGMVIKEKIKNF